MSATIPFAEYERLRGERWSDLQYMATSPLAYREHKLNPKGPTRIMDNGSAIHTAVLEPHLFDAEHVLYDGRRGTNDFKAFEAEHVGQTILNGEQWDACMGAAEAVHLLRQGREARKAMRGCRHEVTLRWTDPRTRILCKARPDLVGSHVLSDVKTTTSVEARKFGRLAGDRLYHGKMAMAFMGLRELGKRIYMVRIIAVEQSPPHDVAVYYLTMDQIDAGIDLVNELLSKLKVCRRRNSWPGRQEREEPLELAPWLLADAGAEEDVMTGLRPASIGG